MIQNAELFRIVEILDKRMKKGERKVIGNQMTGETRNRTAQTVNTSRNKIDQIRFILDCRREEINIQQ